MDLVIQVNAKSDSIVGRPRCLPEHGNRVRRMAIAIDAVLRPAITIMRNVTGFQIRC